MPKIRYVRLSNWEGKTFVHTSDDNFGIKLATNDKNVTASVPLNTKSRFGIILLILS